ncbi:hypothetical protein ACIQH6_18950 [Micromonospora orduensis]|uniref:hypothetical protein n=1 Tax=Micromonospora orduensis TaxID=1420891 RepID=UPI003806522D
MVTNWIAQTQAERGRAEADLRTIGGTTPRQMSRPEIMTLVTALGDITTVLRDADPADEAEADRQLGLWLNYQPERKRCALKSISARTVCHHLCPRGDTTHCPTADDAQRNSEARASLAVCGDLFGLAEEVFTPKRLVRALPVGSGSQMTELRRNPASSAATLHIVLPYAYRRGLRRTETPARASHPGSSNA